jgi:hypothetical protein
VAMKLGLENHEFNVNVPKAYFDKKFNLIISQSNQFKGIIRSGQFKGSGGFNHFPLYMGVIQLLTFDFRSSEDKGNTVFEGTTFYNFELVWVYFIAIILMLIIPASNLFPAAQIKEPTYFLYAGLLVLLSSFLFWFIRNSKQQCLKQFKIILRKVEAAYLMQ